MNLAKTVTALAVLLSLAVPARAEVILKYADHNPPTGPKQEAVLQWFKEIEKETGGRVKIKPYFGGVLGNATETLKLVKDGSVDIGYIISNFYPRQLVAHNIFRLFPIWPQEWENLSNIYDEIYRTIPEYTEEFKRQNQMPLLVLAMTPAVLNARYPVKSLDDLKGKKFNSGDRWQLLMLKNAGAVPVSLPWGDMYMALQTGAIDGRFGDIEGMHITKLDEAAGYLFVHRSMGGGTAFIHSINLDTWNNKLSEEDRQGVLRATQTIKKKVFGPVFASYFDDVIKAQKQPVAEWSEKDLARWTDEAFLGTLRAQWVKEAEELGVKDARQIMDSVNAIIQKNLK